MAEHNKVSTKQIGDGKLPNRYWVSICNDFYYQKEGVQEWASERDKFEIDCSTLAKFNTYKGAKDFVLDELLLGTEYEGIMVNCITIEDRLSGQLYKEAMYEVPRLQAEHEEDLQFTIDEMKRRGVDFK